MTDWQPLAAELAAQLAADGVLTPEWRDAFEQVPRHMFLPDLPMPAAYGNSAVTTQTRPAQVAGGASVQMPTSSASQPAVVAVMLDRLAMRRGQRVLEIGTGTGYNAALLCHRLGERNVYSIDIDPDLVDSARRTLAGVGYHPMLAAGDGYHGLPDGAPYNAIIATSSVSHIPPPWIDQLTDDGRIVAPLHGPGQALMVLRKTADDEVTGRFDDHPAAFMPLRDQLENPLAPGQRLGVNGPRIPHSGTTGLDPQAVADAGGDLLLILQLHLPGLQVGTVQRDDGTVVNVNTLGSYADVSLTANETGVWPTIQRGTHRLWDTVEHAVNRWIELGEPRRTRFGVTALTDTSRQYVWLDHEDSTHCWPMQPYPRSMTSGRSADTGGATRRASPERHLTN